MPEKYVYAGFTPFVEAAADKAGLVEPEYRTRARTGWHADAVNLALSQLVEQSRLEATGHIAKGTREQVKARVDKLIASLEVQLSAMKAAVAEVDAAVDAEHPAEKKAVRKPRAVKAAKADALTPPDDIDGDGDEESIPYPGSEPDAPILPPPGDVAGDGQGPSEEDLESNDRAAKKARR